VSLLLSWVPFILAAVVVFAAFSLWERYEERDVEPCRHCSPGVHWHYGDHCPSLEGNRGPSGQAPGTAAAPVDELASSSSSAEFSGESE